MNLVGKNLPQARKRLGMNQQDLCNKLLAMNVSIDRASLSKIETGQRRVTDMELLAFSKALNVSVKYLLTGRK